MRGTAAGWIESRSGLVLRPWQRAVTAAMFPDDGCCRIETFLISTVEEGWEDDVERLVATLYAAFTFPAPESASASRTIRRRPRRTVFDLDRGGDAASWVGTQSAAAVRRRIEMVFPEWVADRCVSADFAGAAGGRFSGITSFTERGRFRHEAHLRTFEELTPVPPHGGRCIRIIDSYAGFTGDHPIFERMWARALAGDRADGDPAGFQIGRLWAFIDQGEEARQRAWLGSRRGCVAYYEEQRRVVAARGRSAGCM